MIKYIVFSALISTVAFAEGEGFAEHKKEAVARIEERAKKLDEHKACVAGAADKEAMKACHEKMKEWHGEKREEHMGKRKERMEKRLEKMNERKKEMEKAGS